MAAQGAAVLAAERAAQAPLPQQQAQYNPRLPGRTMAVFHRNSRFSAILLYGSAVIWCREKKASLKKGRLFRCAGAGRRSPRPGGLLVLHIPPMPETGVGGLFRVGGDGPDAAKARGPGDAPSPAQDQDSPGRESPARGRLRDGQILFRYVLICHNHPHPYIICIHCTLPCIELQRPAPGFPAFFCEKRGDFYTISECDADFAENAGQ